MNIDKFMEVIKGSRVERWHTRPTIKTQNNAEHQWRVAMICLHIDPTISKLGLMAALTHDSFEHKTGDMPYFTKVDNPSLGHQMKGAENYFRELLELPTTNEPDEIGLIKIADRICAFIYALEEMQLGNHGMSDVSRKIMDAITRKEYTLSPESEENLHKLLFLITQSFLGEDE